MDRPTDVSISIEWLSCFYADEKGHIGIDYSRAVTMALIYPYVFFINAMDEDRPTIKINPDPIRLLLLQNALVLRATGSLVKWAVDGKTGKLLLSQDCLQTSLILPKNIGEQQEYDIEEILSKEWEDRSYSRFYDSPLDELTSLYNTLGTYLCGKVKTE